MGDSKEDIPVLQWHDVIRRRPAMYVGDTGRLGVRFLARGIFETPRSPRALSVIIRGSRFALSAVSAPISVRPREEGKPIYLVEVFTRIQVPLDDPPSIAAAEAVDITVEPVVFRETGQGPSAPAIANALSRELVVTTSGRGVLTEARFVRGALISPPSDRSTSAQDGVHIEFDLDPDIFEPTDFVFEDLAEELRDLALRRGIDVELRDEARQLVFKASGAG